MKADDLTKVHVVFGMSAAGSIRQAFDQIGCSDRVIGMPDDLSFGPIDCADAEIRRAGVEALLDCEWEAISQFTELFWADVLAPDTLPVAWVCRNHPAEYAGFLEFLHRVEQSAFYVIDATSIAIPSSPNGGSFMPWSLGLLSPEQIIARHLADRRVSLSANEIEAYRSTWQRLKLENAPFRIVDGTNLVSAPLTYFDKVIVSCATAKWDDARMVVGRSMMEFYDRPFREMPSDLVIWSRVRALANIDSLEIRGDGTDLRGSFVRRPERKISL